MRILGLLFSSIILVGCGTGVGGTVAQDFGLKDRPDDYVSGSDRVMKSMRAVGVTEMKRLNMKNRHGEIKFEESGRLGGRYYKEVRVYTKAYPLDAQPSARRGNRKESGFVGLMEYAYELKESPRFTNRTEAGAAVAEIPGIKRGRERYRYHFGQSGDWDGSKGDLVN